MTTPRTMTLESRECHVNAPLRSVAQSTGTRSGYLTLVCGERADLGNYIRVVRVVTPC